MIVKSTEIVTKIWSDYTYVFILVQYTCMRKVRFISGNHFNSAITVGNLQVVCIHASVEIFRIKNKTSDGICREIISV